MLYLLHQIIQRKICLNVPGKVEKIGDESNGTQINHIYIRSDVFTNPALLRTIPHEIGHFLGLRHPSSTISNPDPAGDSKAELNADSDTENLLRQSIHTTGTNLKRFRLILY